MLEYILFTDVVRVGYFGLNSYFDTLKDAIENITSKKIKLRKVHESGRSKRDNNSMRFSHVRLPK